MSLLRGAVTGQYEAAGPSRIAEADCVIAHSFGTSIFPNSVNGQLGLLAAYWANVTETPLIADHVLAEALPAHAPKLAATTEGEIASATGAGLGTWGTFLAAEEYMAHYNLRNPIIVAQAFHVGRTAVQAVKLDMKPILPPGLPRQFDRDSDQKHTRYRGAWIPREIIGAVWLKATGKL